MSEGEEATQATANRRPGCPKGSKNSKLSPDTVHSSDIEVDIMDMAENNSHESNAPPTLQKAFNEIDVHSDEEDGEDEEDDSEAEEGDGRDNAGNQQAASEDDEDEEDAEDSPLPKPKKRKIMKDSKGRKASKQEGASTRKAMKDIMYTMVFYDTSEYSKDLSKRKEWCSEVFKLSANASWAKFSNKIRRVIKEVHGDISGLSFNLHYKIPFKAGGQVNLVEEKVYSLMLERVAKQNPNVNLYASARKKASDNDSDDNDDSNVKENKKPKSKLKGKSNNHKKTTKPEEKFDNATQERMKELMDRWACSRPSHKHCYWTEDDPEHKDVSITMFRNWAQALLQNNPDVATVDKPPNNPLFDRFQKRTTQISPLLQARKNTMFAPPFPYYPYPPGTYLSTPTGPAAVNAFLSTPTPPAAMNTSPEPLFKEVIAKDAEYMKTPVKTFSEIFHLRDELCDRLLQMGFVTMRSLRQVTVPQLKEMGFPDGDIITLSDAVEDWLKALDEGIQA